MKPKANWKGRHAVLLSAVWLALAWTTGAVRESPAPFRYAGEWPGYPRGPALGIAVSGDHAYIAAGRAGLVVADITDPSRPVRVGGWCTGVEVNQVKVDGQRAYLRESIYWRGGGCEGETAEQRIQIVDVEDPTQPESLGTMQPGLPMRSLDAANGRLYLVEEDALRIINVSDPTDPRELGRYVEGSGQLHQLQVRGDYAYVVTGESVLRILDVSHPAAPLSLGALSLPGSARAIDVSGDCAFVANEPGALHIVEIRDPQRPVLLGGLRFSGGVEGLCVAEGYAYVAQGEAGLLIIDVRDPVRPVGLGRLPTSQRIHDVAAAAGLVYLAEDEKGLRIADVSDPGQPLEAATLPTGGRINDLVLREQRAFLADGWAGLRILDLSDPEQPAVTGEYPTEGEALSIDVAGVHAYVGQAAARSGKPGGGLLIVDVSDPSRPALLGRYGDTDLRVGAVRVVGEHVCLLSERQEEAEWITRFEVIAVTDPHQPVQVWESDRLRVGAAPSELPLRLAGRYAYAATDLLHIFDLADPSRPIRLSSSIRLNGALALEITDGVAYVGQSAEGSDEVAGFDVTNPAAPKPLSGFHSDGVPHCLHARNGYLHIASGWSGLAVKDVSDRDALFDVLQVRFEGEVTHVQLTDDLAVLGNDPWGLTILRMPDEPVTILEPLTDRTLIHGETATVQVRAYGSFPRTYQWYWGESGDTSRPIPDANGHTYRTPPLRRAAACWVRIATPVASLDSRTVEFRALPGLSFRTISRTARAARCLALQGDYLYGAWPRRDHTTFVVQEVRHPDRPDFVAGIFADGLPRALCLTDGFVCLVGTAGLQMIDVRDPEQPGIVGRLPEIPDALDVQTSDGYAFVGTVDGSLHIVDARDPTGPTLVGSYLVEGGGAPPPPLEERLTMIALADERLYLAARAAGLHIVDVSDPAQPKRLGVWSTEGPALGVAVRGDHAYLSSEFGLDVLDVSDPLQPWLAGRCPDCQGSVVRVEAHYVYLARSGLQVVDVRDPTRPALVAFLEGPIRELVVQGNRLYTVGGPYLIFEARLAASLAPPVVASETITLSWEGGDGIALQWSSSLNPPQWEEIPGSLGADSIELPLSSAGACFRLATVGAD